VYLVDFITRIYHDARSPERQNLIRCTANLQMAADTSILLSLYIHIYTHIYIYIYRFHRYSLISDGCLSRESRIP